MFKWYDTYATGHAEIDADHKHLFRLAEEFHKAVTEGTARDHMAETLDALLSYTQYHFSREEFAMRTHRYDAYQAHQAQHDALIRNVNDLVARFESGDNMAVLDLTDLLRTWLVDHIMKQDTKLAEFLQHT